MRCPRLVYFYSFPTSIVVDQESRQPSVPFSHTLYFPQWHASQKYHPGSFLTSSNTLTKEAWDPELWFDRMSRSGGWSSCACNLLHWPPTHVSSSVYWLDLWSWYSSPCRIMIYILSTAGAWWNMELVLGETHDKTWSMWDTWTQLLKT